MLLVAAVDVALFHFGLYRAFLRPESYAGRFESSIRDLDHARRTNGGQRVTLVLGDSTIRAAVTEWRLEQLLASRGRASTVLDLAQGGSTARTWAIQLRLAELDRHNTDLVVLGIHPYSLAPGFADEKPDLEIVKSRLTLCDAGLLLRSYRSGEVRAKVIAALVLRTPLFRQDVDDLLSAPPERWRRLQAQRDRERLPRAQRAALGDFGEVDGSLASLRFDADGRLREDTVPPSVRTPEQREQIERHRRERLSLSASHAVEAPPVDELQWRSLRAAVETLSRRGVPVVFAVTPSSPWDGGALHFRWLEERVASLAREGFAVALFADRSVLAAVETPESFADLLHLNRAGAELYTRGLAAFLLDQNWK